MATPFAPRPGSPISDRERQILAGLARGRTNAQIAEDLDLSPHTVKSHIERITHRYGARGRAGLVGIAYRRGDLASLKPEPRDQVVLGKATLTVLDGMARGLTNREIGRLRGRDEETVRSLARRMFRKLGAHHRAHAVALGYQHGYLPLQQAAERAA